jgi:hypothetical protein
MSVKSRKKGPDRPDVDDSRSFARARAAWETEFGDYPWAFSRFHLSTAQIEAILAAPKKPLQLAYVLASDEIESLTWELNYSAVYRTTHERRARDHAEKLAAAGEKFARVLFDESTDDVVLFAFPPGRLARLRQEFGDFIDYVEYQIWASAKDKEWDSKVRKPCSSSADENKPPSALEYFIRTSLVEAFEKIYNIDAGRSRRRSDGAPSGPFIAFGTCFFREVAYPVAAETIARALAPRWGKSGAD